MMGFQWFSVVFSGFQWFSGLLVLDDHLVGYFLRFMMLFSSHDIFVIGLTYNILNANFNTGLMYDYVALRLEFCC